MIRTIRLLSLLGFLAAGYSLFHHYAIRFSSSYESFCNLSEKVNCDAVALHPSSEILGVPVAAYGAAAYIALLLLTIRADENRQFIVPLVISMFAFSIYLASVSAFLIGSFCIVCIFSYVINLALIFSTMYWQRGPKAMLRNLGDFFTELHVK